MKRIYRNRFWIAILTTMILLCTACGTGQTQNQTDRKANQEEMIAQENTEELEQATDADNSTDKESGESVKTDETSVKDDTNSGEAIPALRDCVPERMGGTMIGCAVTGSEADDPKVWDILTTHFNAVTLGNELKPDSLFSYSNDRCPGTKTVELNGEEIELPKMNFNRPEHILKKILAWNEEHPDRQIKVRGHVLVWHSQTPEWFFHENYNKKEDYVDKETMNKRLECYIREVLTYFTGEDSPYKDLFYGWDVVNEAISDSGVGLRTDAENPNESLSMNTHGSNSSWYHIYGDEEFILNAFRYANKYAPESLELYYNDYNECNAPKREAIVKLLTTIKENEGPKGEGTRISAMGMQGHYSMDYPGFTDIEYSAKAYANVVGKVQITELDISASSEYDGSEAAKESEYEKLRKRYNTIYFTLKSVNETDECDITGITFWGTVDHYSWLQSRSNVGGGNTTGLPQCPLLFDENYNPKPCFYVFTEIK